MKDTYIIDIEATSLYTSTANILQLCALKYSDDFNEWELNNWYFNPRNPIPFEVKNITGLNEEYLKEKSGGLFFEETCDEMLKLFDTDNLLIGHNIIKYDSTVIKNNFSRVGIKLRSFPRMYDTMLEAKNLSYVHTGKYINLRELFRMSCEHVNLDGKLLMNKLMDIFNFDEHERSAHNAKYDVLMNGLTYYIMKRNIG